MTFTGAAMRADRFGILRASRFSKPAANARHRAPRPPTLSPADETRAEYEANHLPADIEFESQIIGKRGPWRVKFEDDAGDSRRG